MWHFPRNRTTKLKPESSPVGSGSRISTYGTIVGLPWKATTRAKLSLLNHAPSKATLMGHGMNAHSMTQSKLDEGYLDNAIFTSSTSRVPIQEGLAEGNIAKLAASIRSSFQAVSPQATSKIVERTEGLHNPRFVTIAINAFLGMDFVVAGWQVMTPYEKHGFGLGPPEALRLPHPQFEGYTFVMPSRRMVKPKATDEGILKHVSASKEVLTTT